MDDVMSANGYSTINFNSDVYYSKRNQFVENVKGKLSVLFVVFLQLENTI